MIRRVILNAIFPGEPVAWQRAGAHGKRFFNRKEMRAAQTKLRRQLKMMKPGLLPDARARFGAQFVFSCQGAEKDADNCIKLVLDAFQGKIWQNDRHVLEGQWKMEYGAECPQTHLIVYKIE